MPVLFLWAITRRNRSAIMWQVPIMCCPPAARPGFHRPYRWIMFVKQTSLLHYSRDAFHREANDIMCLANVEGLGAHAGSVNIRRTKD